MKYATPGTISHGTLNARDLVPAFAGALDSLANQNRYTSDGDEMRLVALNSQVDDLLGRIERCQAERPDYFEMESSDWHLNDLIDLLSEFAPPGHYFGAHEGDGSDFGFWPCSDEEI